jgi:putative transposase
MARKELRRFLDRVARVRQQFDHEQGLPFRNLLSTDVVSPLLDELGLVFRECIYTPAVTLWVFLSQVISADHSCRDAVTRLLAFRVANGQEPCSPETGAYCTARGKLPEQLFTRLVKKTAEQSHRAVEPDWRWHGHDVKLVDGTTVTMADTPENQAAYPQQKNQQPGLGFPIIRLVCVFSLAVGVVLDFALGRYEGKQTGENQLFRGMLASVVAGDVVLADRCFAAYWDFAMLQEREAHLVTRLHQLRRADFRRGTRLGPCDHLVVWPKPPRPEWMDRARYASIPDELVIRELKVRVSIAGFRVGDYVVATTLLDPERYTAEAIGTLYRARWHAELDLRSLKTVMQMDHLRCQTPEMVRKELCMHLVAYNLIRATIAEAARYCGMLPRELSFKGSLQTLQAFRVEGLLAKPTAETIALLLSVLASHRVGDRPNRIEPRVVKRRRKPYKHLPAPRQLVRRSLLAHA